MKKKTMCSPYPASNAVWEGPPIALLWDQSLVWGLMCLKTLEQFRVPCRLVTSKDIGGGVLDDHRVVLVPGGWASHKVRELGEAGKSRIEQHVRDGGSYLGFCGGAGLALSSPPSLGLVPLERLPPARRLPSASGEVWLEGDSKHPAWKDMPSTLPVTVWWPSQFYNPNGHEVIPVATYRSYGKGFMVADIPVEDMARAHGSRENIPWEKLEKIYGINLNPAKLLGDTAILEASLDLGRLVLSYPHLETPGCTWGNRLLLNLLRYLDRRAADHLPHRGGMHAHSPRCGARAFVSQSPVIHPAALELLLKAKERADSLIALGEHNLLWRWRNPWLLNWRRGIRGLEYGMLAVSLRCAVSLARQYPTGNSEADSSLLAPHETQELYEDIVRFCILAERLLMEEKTASQDGGISKLSAVNRSVDDLRRELFGKKMSHGGLSCPIFNRLDGMLLELIRNREASETLEHTRKARV